MTPLSKLSLTSGGKIKSDMISHKSVRSLLLVSMLLTTMNLNNLEDTNR